MKPQVKLTLVKLLHTAIWVFFNLVIFYPLYAAIINKIDKWVWICFGLILFEGFVLLLFKMRCPLTLVAEKYSDSQKANFDIFLPEWLAKYNKLIYTIIVVLILAFVIVRLTVG